MIYRIGFWILFLYLLTSCRAVPTPVTPDPTAVLQIIPAQNELQIQKYPNNYTSFKLKTPSGIILILDPYAMDEDVQAEIVTSSHHHVDHTDFSRITGKYELINTPGVFNLHGIQITGVAGHHNKYDPEITNIIYTFDLEGIHLAEFASQGEMPTEEMFTQIGKVDILIIQFFSGTGSKLSTQDAVLIAQKLRAKIIIPAHGEPGEAEVLASLLNAPIENIATGKLTVTQEGLAKQSTPKVVRLDH